MSQYRRIYGDVIVAKTDTQTYTLSLPTKSCDWTAVVKPSPEPVKRGLLGRKKQTAETFAGCSLRLHAFDQDFWVEGPKEAAEFFAILVRQQRYAETRSIKRPGLARRLIAALRG